MFKKLTSPFSRPSMPRDQSKPQTLLSRVPLEKKDGKYVFAPRSLEDLDKFDRVKEATDKVNQTVDLIRDMQAKAKMLDNTDVDTNPWEGEVAVKGMEFGDGRSADVTVSRSYSPDGYELEAELQGSEGSATYIKDSSPFSQNGMESSVRDLTFQVGDMTYQLADKDAHKGFDTSFLTVLRD